MNIDIERLMALNIFNNTLAISLPDALISMVMALAFGMIIYITYAKVFDKVSYSYNFGLSLIAICMITTSIVMVITSNVIVSIGMVGALSIIRFRSVIKDPLDIVFVFWSVGTGIIVASGMFILAIISMTIIALSLMMLANKCGRSALYILVINCKSDSEDEIIHLIKEKTKKNRIKSKSFNEDDIELQIELKLLNNDTKFLTELSKRKDVRNTYMLSYNGEYVR